MVNGVGRLASGKSQVKEASVHHSSISGLMTAVLICGVGIAAMRDASDLWAGVLLLLTLFLLGVSLLGVLHRRDAKRAFWQGFALFGWGYMILVRAPWFAEQVQPKLATTQLLSGVHARLASSSSDINALYALRSEALSDLNVQ